MTLFRPGIHGKEALVAERKVVIIGAGIGGLAAALLLASRGVAVTVAEKEAAPGGKVRRVTVNGAAIDGGPTVFTMRGVFDDLFSAAGAKLEDYVRITPAENIARHWWGSGDYLDLPADAAAREAAIEAFAGPAAADAYRAFAAEARRIHDILDQPFMRASRVYPPGLMWRIGLSRIGDLLAIRPYESLWKVLGEHFHDQRLRQLFARYSTYCGSSPMHAPATLMLIAEVEARGTWLLEGGLSALAAAMERLASELGVVFHYGAPVSEVLGERRANGVRLANGQLIEADAVIVNADPAALAAGRFGPLGRRAASSFAPRYRSLSAFTWLMEARVSGAPLVRHNIFFSPDYPREFADLAADRVPQTPSVYVCALDRSATGESSAEGQPERLQIIINAPANGDTHTYLPEEIDRCTRLMLERLQASGLTLTPTAPPYVATPGTFDHLFPSTGGALYGRASHGWAASFLRQSARTKIRGLYCAGGSTHPGSGVPMAALSGRLAAMNVLKDLALTAQSAPAVTPGGMSTRLPMEATSA